MKRALLSLFSCYAEVAEAAINGSTLLRLVTSSDSDPRVVSEDAPVPESS